MELCISRARNSECVSGLTIIPGDVTPVFSRIRLRGYVETNERAVVELRNAGFSTLNILLWVTVLHKIHSRQAAASIVANVVANKLLALPIFGKMGIGRRIRIAPWNRRLKTKGWSERHLESRES